MKRPLFGLLCLVLLGTSGAVGPRASAEDAPARYVHEGANGTVHVHGTIGRRSRAPVLVAEPSVAKALWAGLATQRDAFVLVATKDLAPFGRLRDNGRRMRQAVTDALVDAAGVYRDLPLSPWIAVGNGASAGRLTRVALNGPRWQGLVLLGSPVAPASVPDAATGDTPAAVLLAMPVPGGGEAWSALKSKLEAARFPVQETPLSADPKKALDGSGCLAAIRHARRQLKRELEFRELTRSQDPARLTVKLAAADGLPITGDVYGSDTSAPVVVLFHQARSSRGEYAMIAPRLVEAGYTCLAIDQRSGDHWSGIKNATAARARIKRLKTNYIDARPDLDAAIKWLRKEGYKGKLAIVGSSYSSSLAIYIGADNPDVNAVVSFSPGDYLPPRGSILEAAKRLDKPTLVVCPPREEGQAKQVYGPIAAEAKELYVQPEGIHGASTLYRSPTKEAAWKRLLAFLAKHLK